MSPGSRLLLLLLLLPCAACSSVAWQPRPTPQTWRGASLWRTEQITLAAADESTAEELLSLHERLCAAFVRVDVAPPPPPLLFAVGVDDELLFGDPVRTIDVLTAWHHEFVHGPAAGGAPPPSERSRTEVPADAPPEMVRMVAKTLAAAVPLQAPELDLPVSWRAIATWGLVVPTEACIEVAAEAVLDHGLAKADVGFGQRLLLAPLMPWIRGKMRTELRDAMLRQVVDAYLARAGGSRLAPAKKQGLLAALGVAVDPSGPDPETSLRSEGLPGR